MCEIKYWIFCLDFSDCNRIHCKALSHQTITQWCLMVSCLKEKTFEFTLSFTMSSYHLVSFTFHYQCNFLQYYMYCSIVEFLCVFCTVFKWGDRKINELHSSFSCLVKIPWLTVCTAETPGILYVGHTENFSILGFNYVFLAYFVLRL